MNLGFGGGSTIPVTVVFDASGFVANLPAHGATLVTSTGCKGCVASATLDASTGLPAVIGAVPVAMTTFNMASTTLNNLFHLSTDGMVGSPMTKAPFPGSKMNFDFTSMTATNLSAVPVPAAVRLFGHGLVGASGNKLKEGV